MKESHLVKDGTLRRLNIDIVDRNKATDESGNTYTREYPEDRFEREPAEKHWFNTIFGGFS